MHESTKEKVRYAALMAGLRQSELVEHAVDEYVERHREEFVHRMERAREALLGGKSATLAYTLGVAEEDVARLGGVASDHVGGSRRPRRATSNHAREPDGQSARGSDTSARAASKASRKSTSRSPSST